jgi:hypothetical protein
MCIYLKKSKKGPSNKVNGSLYRKTDGGNDHSVDDINLIEKNRIRLKRFVRPRYIEYIKLNPLRSMNQKLILLLL